MIVVCRFKVDEGGGAQELSVPERKKSGSWSFPATCTLQQLHNSTLHGVHVIYCLLHRTDYLAKQRHVLLWQICQEADASWAAPEGPQ